jgi:hypothetical protein
MFSDELGDPPVSHRTIMLESFVVYSLTGLLVRFSAMLYTPEGKAITQRIWDETLAEFAFADVRGILDHMKA